MTRPRIIAFAYACEPGEGSEPGTGWAWARMLASLGDAWVITRANNRPAIEAALPTTPERDTLRFVYVDLPPWARRWKRGQQGVRLYYLLWQLAALRAARGLAPRVEADLAWHVTFANAWLGSLAPLTGLPFVYGPVGGGAGMPWRLLLAAPKDAAAWELARAIASASARYFNPLARLAWRRADVILAQNRETRDWFPARHRRKVTIHPNTVIELDKILSGEESHVDRTAVFAGRLVYLKGVELAIRAIARAPQWQLRIFGEGPEEARLRRIVEEVAVADRVTFCGWIARDDLRSEMGASQVLLFPSLHEQAGWAVAEALACGLAVVCCDIGGPPDIAGGAGIAVIPGDVDLTAHRLAAALTSGELPTPDAALKRAAFFSREAHLDRLRDLLDVNGSKLDP